MNEAKLFEQLFDDENPKESSKSNVNLLENLFDAPVACSAKNKKVKDKQNKDSVEHELIKLAEKKTHLVKKATYSNREPKKHTETEVRSHKNSEALKEYIKLSKVQIEKKKEEYVTKKYLEAYEREMQKQSQGKEKDIKNQDDTSQEHKNILSKRKYHLKKEKLNAKDEDRDESTSKKSKHSKHSKHNKHKHRKFYDSDDGFIASDGDDYGNAIQQVRKIMGYNPSDKKFRELDKYEIRYAGVHEILKYDRISYKFGRLEELYDWYREKMRKLKKEHR